jgi:hypothetical protein
VLLRSHLGIRFGSFAIEMSLPDPPIIRLPTEVEMEHLTLVVSALLYR